MCLGFLRNLFGGFEFVAKMVRYGTFFSVYGRVWLTWGGTILLKLIISSIGRSKSTNRFRRITTLGIRMSVHNPESDRILSASWIRSDSLSDSSTWVDEILHAASGIENISVTYEETSRSDTLLLSSYFGYKYRISTLE
jgi:hypothetical protein